MLEFACLKYVAQLGQKEIHHNIQRNNADNIQYRLKDMKLYFQHDAW